VSVLLDEESGRYRVLVVKRVESSIDPWSGDWALPGGRMESTDPDLRATAIRETFEETGIDLMSSAEFMFELDFFSPTNAPQMHVKPFAYRLLKRVDVRLSHELSDYMWVYLDELRESIDQSGRPEFRLVGGGRIWGMTARILLAVKERLGYR